MIAAVHVYLPTVLETVILLQLRVHLYWFWNGADYRK